ncbi:Gfo/Idh/MocA family oxidoreductase [Planomicrobium sp. Y74]|uniref:Gfo/Idh/MocA family protein n=1 Tax=Planomicrobium sp. Y74 TaxID=2478977 RepID=UPI000EF54ECA|nr:Gfo/Idh/MocA family oxidoreductase [Planomicrobium sp. Y74]RLQ91246.1 gfo/Idh/MocA family oxidoreductase [Planomicrobium sp. Y74]
MEMEKISWGVLSTANIGLTQVIPAIGRAENAELAAIASRSGKVHAIAEEHGISRAYESYEALLADSEIDAVYIPLPNHLHKEWTMKAAAAGKHVLCEKPAALTEAEAEEMVAFCQSQNVKFAEAFMYQLHPQHGRVKEIMASGEIGDIRLIKSGHSFYMADRETNIRMDKKMGGGSLYDLGCYSIQVFRHLTDAEPLEVQAFAEMDKADGVDMTAHGWLRFEGGILALFDCSFDMLPRNEYEVIGTKGSIRVPYAFRPDIVGGVGSIIVKAGDGQRTEEVDGDSYRLEVEDFSSAILEDRQPWISGDSTIRNMRVLDACYESISTGQSVQLTTEGSDGR